MFDIAVSPQGHLVLVDSAPLTAPAGDEMALPKGLTGSLRDAFERGHCEGLVHLATIQGQTALPPTFAFWRGLGERYLTELCPHAIQSMVLPI